MLHCFGIPGVRRRKTRIITDIMMKQSRWLKDDLKPRENNTKSRPTDFNNQALTISNRLENQPSLTSEVDLTSCIKRGENRCIISIKFSIQTEFEFEENGYTFK